MTACTAAVPGCASAQWRVWSTIARVVVTDPEAIEQVRSVVGDTVGRVDLAASRFRADSEVCQLARREESGPVQVSATLSDLLRTALVAARRTGGAVDPTLGWDLVGLGYDRDIEAVRAIPAAPRGGGPDRVRPGGVAWIDTRPGVDLGGGGTLALTRPFGWRDIELSGRTLRMPTGVLLDLGATAKARAADLAASAAAQQYGCGVLVSLGGDIRVAGPPPGGGWQILVQDGRREPASRIRLDGADGVATSSTLHRTWLRHADPMHHILDPAVRRPAEPVWRTVSVAADTCVRANELTTAAVVRGAGARALLREAGVAARLVDARGAVHTLGGWPA